MRTKLIPETLHYRIFKSKFIWNHLYLYIFCIIYLGSFAKVFEHHIELRTGSLVKPSV